ncbi:MAG: hypothetical protein LBD21_11215, partial [Tannerellaceae bacterium]|nr:hypothetical protein [Tannerellaceae bacterium]
NFKEFTFAISFPKKILRKLQMEFPCGKLFGANSKRDRLPERFMSRSSSLFYRIRFAGMSFCTYIRANIG